MFVRTKVQSGWWTQLADTENPMAVGKGLIFRYNRRQWTFNSNYLQGKQPHLGKRDIRKDPGSKTFL